MYLVCPRRLLSIGVLVALLALNARLLLPAHAQPPIPSPSPTLPASPTPLPVTPAVGEPLLTLRVPDRLYLHTPDPPDVLGFQAVIVSAVAATVHVTATLGGVAIPATGSVFPVHQTIPIESGMDTAFVFSQGFTSSPDTPIGSQACIDMQWSMQAGLLHHAQACATVVGIGGVVPSLPTPAEPTTAPVVTAPCYLAALAALTRQGALYSQGGALNDDPINPKTNKPYPRTGPNSFDCSGLVWWAYAQAGIPIGQTTFAQLNDGVRLPCTLDDLQGAQTRCWTLGDLVFLAYPGGQHVAIYVGQGLFMDCYNHAVGCVLHDVSQDPFYQAHFLEARRIVSGCEELTIDPGVPLPPPLEGAPESDTLCIPDPPHWVEHGIGYSRGCGPPVLPPDPTSTVGTSLRQFSGTVGWLREADSQPSLFTDSYVHVGIDVGTTTDMCRWPNQLRGVARGQPPPGASQCTTSWADPMQFLPQANGDSLHTVAGTPVPVAVGQAGDPTLADTLIQLPPPGHPAGQLLPASDPEQPGGTWWSPGNADRAQQARCPLGGPSTHTWLSWLAQFLFPWLFGC